MQMVRRAKAESIEFGGIVFRRYPESRNWADRYYYRPSSHLIAAGIEALHREIWKAHNGPIPPGHHVHHKDRNPLNNDISNLECVPAREHGAIHFGGNRSHEWTVKQREHLAKIRPLSHEWIKTPEGRLRAAANARRMWEKIQPTKQVCVWCGAEYETPFPTRSLYCSPKCRGLHRYAKRLDFEKRNCAYCGKEFEVHKASPTRNCSRSCAAKQRQRNARGCFQSDD